jgi:hypothetical protein
LADAALGKAPLVPAVAAKFAGLDALLEFIAPPLQALISPKASAQKLRMSSFEAEIIEE